MPPVRKSGESFNFGAFPAPPPEAETWEPDPDSIARPGELKDERFSRNHYQDSRLRTARKEFGHHMREDSSIVQSPQYSPVRAQSIDHLAKGQWPPQEMRSYRPEVTAPFPARVTSSDDSVGSLPETAKISPAPVPSCLVPSNTTTPTVKVSDTKAFPLWASSLEQMMLETPSSTVPPIDAAKKSLPPHLRKSAGTTSRISSGHSYQRHHGSQSRASALDADYEAACEASRRVSSPTAVQVQAYYASQGGESTVVTTAPDADTTSPTSVLDKLFEALEQSATVVAPDPSSTDYGHHLKVSMLLNMITDLLELELLKLSDKELEGRITKISSLSEHRWQQVHGKGVTPDTVPDGHQSNGVAMNGHSMNGSSRGPQANGFSNVLQHNGSRR